MPEPSQNNGDGRKTKGRRLTPEAPPVTPPTTFDAPRNRLKVLLAEDLLTHQELVVEVLTRRGHSVEVAKNGREALRAWEQRPFDLILMDVQMPVMDGLQAVAAIRAAEAPRAIRVPIVALTASVRPGDQDWVDKSGMDELVGKPIDVATLIRVVEALGEPTVRRDQMPAAADDHDDDDSEGVYDREPAIARLAGSTKLFRDLAGFFQEDMPAHVAQLRTALDQGEPTEVRRAAHSLANLAAVFDGWAALAVARAIQDHAEAHRLDEAEGQFDRLRREFQRLDRALQAERNGDD